MTASHPSCMINSDPSIRCAMGDSALILNGVTVAYRSYKERPTSAKETIIQMVRDRKFRHYSTFDALSNVSLTVKKGRVLGIMGSNGSGKSTLLKVVAGVLVPTTGTVLKNGSVSSLIELGAGFDPELSAIENLYLHAALHQKSKSFIRDRIPHILRFAELEEFANTPVKYYSSGMYARLGFSAAIDVDPDILLVDEILSVGDERFNEKSANALKEFIARGKTVIIVSHSAESLTTLTDEVAVMARGSLVFLGEPQAALEVYRNPEYQRRLE
jgi:ABC-2 type transport system ATP-binding protein